MTNQSPYSRPPAHPEQENSKPAKKPFYKRWWVWLIAIFAVLSITAPFIDDDFNSEEEKQSAWEAYKCSRYSDLTAQPEGKTISMELMWDKIPTEKRVEAMRWSRKLIQAGNSKTVGSVMEYTDTPTANDMCTGWLWERYKQRQGFWDGYDNFTLENARNEGVVSEG